MARPKIKSELAKKFLSDEIETINAKAAAFEELETAVNEYDKLVAKVFDARTKLEDMKLSRREIIEALDPSPSARALLRRRKPALPAPAIEEEPLPTEQHRY